MALRPAWRAVGATQLCGGAIQTHSVNKPSVQASSAQRSRQAAMPFLSPTRRQRDKHFDNCAVARASHAVGMGGYPWALSARTVREAFTRERVRKLPASVGG